MNRIIVILVFILLPAGPLFAIGLGFYTNGDFGYYNFKNQTYSLVNPDLRKTENTVGISPGIGIILDTNCAKDKLFNYRLKIGVEKVYFMFKGDSDFYRFNLINTFGFGVLRRDNIRVWLGPLLGLHYIYGKRTIEDVGQVPSIYTIYYSGPFKQKLEYGSLNADLGLNIGVNVNFSKLITLSFDLGLSCTYASGYIYRKIYGYTFPPELQKRTDEHFRFIGFESNITVSCMFRIKDEFKKLESDKPVEIDVIVP